jgi:hypothetical protein
MRIPITTCSSSGRIALAVDRMRWHDEELAGSGLVDRRA